MEMQLFDTELEMSPVDITKIEDNGKEKTEVKKVEPEPEYTIIDVLDKPEPKVEDKEETDESEEVVNETKEQKDSPSEESADSSKFPYSTFAKALYEEGVLSFFDEDEFNKIAEETGSEVEALIEMNKRTISDQIEAYKNSLSDEGRAFLDAIEKGVPLDTFMESKAKNYSYSTIKEDSLADNDDLCKKILKDDLANRGFSDDEIEDQVSDFESLGKLEQKAKISLKRLKAAHEETIQKETKAAEQRQKQIIEENKKQLASLKTEIDKTSEIIPGVKINQKLKSEIYDAITSPEMQLPNGQWINKVYAKRAKDPISWDIKVAYLDALGVFDGKWDSIMKSSKSAAVKELGEKLSGGSISKTGEPAASAKTQSSTDILKSMEVFKNKK